jgi:hypothetical protein
MHSRSGHFWWPIKERVVPLGQFCLALMNVLGLVLNMMLVEAQLRVGCPPVHLMFDLVRGDALIQPALESRVVKSVVTSSDCSLRYIVDLHIGGSEEPRLVLGEQ